MSSADSPATGEALPASLSTGAEDVDYGELIDACAIDLPPNDVIEAIEFERFFIVNARLGELRRPVTLMSALLSMRSEDLSDAELAAVAPNFLLAAPLSNKRREWELFERAETLQPEGTNNPESNPTPEGSGSRFRKPARGSQPREEWSPAGETLAEERAADTGPLASSSSALEADVPFIEGPGTSTGPQTALPAAPIPNLSSFRVAFYLPYRQEWQLDGYSRGRMVNSLTLGPQEEQTIEIFKWG